MASKRPAKLTAAELIVMRIIWQRKSWAAAEVFKDARRHKWSPRTIKNFLPRLVDKGHIEVTRVDGKLCYRPVSSPAWAMASLLADADELLKKAGDGTVALLLAHIITKSKLTGGEIAQLRALLNKRKPSKKSP